MISQHFYSILLIESLGSAHLQGEGITQRHEHQEVGSSRAILEAAYHTATGQVCWFIHKIPFLLIKASSGGFPGFSPESSASWENLQSQANQDGWSPQHEQSLLPGCSWIRKQWHAKTSWAVMRLYTWVQNTNSRDARWRGLASLEENKSGALVCSELN